MSRDTVKGTHPLLGVLILFGAIMVLIGVTNYIKYALISLALYPETVALSDVLVDLLPLLQEHQNNPLFMRTFQVSVMLDTLITFGGAALIAVKLSHLKPFEFTGVTIRPRFFHLLFCFLIMASFFPITEALVEFNQSLSLPEGLVGLEQTIKEMEETTGKLFSIMLRMDTVNDLAINLCMFAVIPAIFEEICFRGALQNFMLKWSKRPHVAIWISAILFSLMHFSFSGFVPRMVLGAVLGYMFFWSNSLWVPILGHFINNASVVALYFILQADILPTENMQIIPEASQTMILWISVAISGLTMFLFYKLRTSFSLLIHSVLPYKSPLERSRSALID